MPSFNSDHRPDPEILVHENNSSVRTLTLNMPRHMNALSHEMISQLSELFLAYDHDTKLKLVMLKFNGKAFCAGGDVAAKARHHSNGDWRSALEESEELYKLLFLIATYNKSQLSVLNGIAMGRGAGIYLAARFPIVTENSTFSMPETAMGGFADMGASYFLSRLPGFFGEYLALTGARLDGPEMLALGLATHFAGASARRRTNGTIMQSCFGKRWETMEDIGSALEKEAIHLENDPWISSTVHSLKKAAPSSLKISLRSIREGRTQGFGDCLVREHRTVYHVYRGNISRDFIEGCTRLLWDKNKIHKWEPSKLELVSEQMVDQYFAKLDDSEELNLPPRSNFHTIAKL